MNTYARYRELLDTFISFKSISTDSKYKDEIKKTAEFLKETFEANQFEVEIVEGYGNPVVLSEYVHDENAETVLVYGHYDVQPADISEGWHADPFEVHEKDGKLFARGAVDNKGQVLIHMVTVFNLIENGNLKYNVKFVIEGDEETGSDKLPVFVEEYKQQLKSDFYIISDGPILGEYPTFDVSFRGVANCEVKISTSSKDLHSGSFGGIVPNAAEEAAKLVANLKNAEHWLEFDGFEETMEKVDDEIVENNKSIPVSEEELAKVAGTKTIFSDSEIDAYTRNGLFTSMEVTGFSSGYTGEGFRNAVPAKATVKINFRIRPWTDLEEFKSLFKSAVEKMIPEYAEASVEFLQEAPGVILDTDHEYMEQAENILEDVFGKKTIRLYQGAIIPIVKDFQDTLGVPGLLINLANEDSDMHAPNENFNIEILKKGIAFSERFFGG